MWKVTTKSPTPTLPFAPIPAQPTDLKKVEVAAAKKRFAESPAGEELAKLIFVGASREKNLRRGGTTPPKTGFLSLLKSRFSHISSAHLHKHNEMGNEKENQLQKSSPRRRSTFKSLVFQQQLPNCSSNSFCVIFV